jgi:pimeloyl-ACP methyl ester carboxylesterase
MAVQNPVIVVGGIQGSVLRDTYPVAPETVWGIGVEDTARIALHPNGKRYERDEPARVIGGGLFTIPYEELVLHLRHELTENANEPTPVFPFGYDWRQPLETTEAELERFVDETIARTLLRRNYYNSKEYAGAPKVDLVGHSMGGLIITGYLQRKGRAARVGKVVTLETPFRGSVEAPFRAAVGDGLFGLGQGKQRERETARLTPALYYLVPSFAGAATGPDGKARDLFDVDTWQTSIFRTLARYIEDYGLKGGDLEAQARELLAEMLGQARANRARLEAFRPADANLTEKDWLVVAGVDQETKVRMRITYAGAERDFEFRREDYANNWTSSDPAQKAYTGDGTVAFGGATPAFIPAESIVCVSANDLEPWELEDKFLVSTIGLHATMPKISLVGRLVVSHLAGRRVRNTWGRPAPGFTKDTWDPPIEGLDAR